MRVIKTERAPRPIGPYSQAMKAGDFLFISGQVGMNPKTRTIVDGGIEAQTRQTFMNIKSILDAAGSSFEKVVKVTVFLEDIKDFKKMNDVYGTYFKTNPPARTTVQAQMPVSDAIVEIDTIAYSA